MLNNEYLNIETLTKEEETELLKKIKNGDKLARKELFERNLKLVYKIAHTYTKRKDQLQDSIQNGSIGLHIAIDKFDIEKNNKFSTYAYYHIKKHIIAGFNQDNKVIRLTEHALKEIKLLKDKENFILLKYKRKATDEELSTLTNFKLDKIKDLRAAMQNTFSLDNFSTKESDCTFTYDIEDKKVNIEKTVETKEAFKYLHSVINDLSREDQEIISKKFGLNGYKIYTDKELAKIFNVDEKEIRKIISKIKNKIKEKLISNNYKLQDFVA